LGNVDGPSGIHRYAGGIVEHRTEWWSAIAAIPRCSITRNGGDGGASDFPDPLIAGVHDVQISSGVERYTGRRIERGAGRGATVSGEPRRAIAGNRSDPSRGNLPDAVIAVIGKIQIAGRIHGYTGNAVEQGAG